MISTAIASFSCTRVLIVYEENQAKKMATCITYHSSDIVYREHQINVLMANTAYIV